MTSSKLNLTQGPRQKPSDVARMARLSVLGFKDSEIFRFERPRYDEFPEDAVASFANLYRSQLEDLRDVVVVVEDLLQQPDEQDEQLCCSPSAQPGTNGTRVVVGVASWILALNASRTDQFVMPGAGHLEPAPDRDLCQRRLTSSHQHPDSTGKWLACLVRYTTHK